MLIMNIFIYISAFESLSAQDRIYPVIIDEVVNGKIRLKPNPSSDGMCAAGTVITVTAVPDPGYVIDSVYYSVKGVPQYLTRGSIDMLIKDEGVKAYMDALAKAGQRVEYVQVGGANHAFFDWKPDDITKATFKKYGIYYCRQMEVFFDSVFFGIK